MNSGLTQEEWEEILKKYDYKCLACGTKDNVIIDYIIPLGRGVSNKSYNVQPLCESCSSKKGTKLDYRYDPTKRKI